MTPASSDGAASLCLKVDVDTHDGMRDGVPRLLDAFAAADVAATFFLSFGPDTDEWEWGDIPSPLWKPFLPYDPTNGTVSYGDIYRFGPD